MKSLVGLAVHPDAQTAASTRRDRLLGEGALARPASRAISTCRRPRLSKLASLAIEQGRLDQAIALGREALDLARHLGDRNRMMIDRCRLAEALVECGHAGRGGGTAARGLELPLEEVEPDMVDYARLLLAQALLETPERGRAAMSGRCSKAASAGFRERRKTRPLLLALALEMELRSRPAARRPLEPVRLEFEALAAQAGSASSSRRSGCGPSWPSAGALLAQG